MQNVCTNFQFTTQMSRAHEHWAITEVWQNKVRDNKWKKDASIVRGMVLALETRLITESTFDIAANNFDKLSEEEQTKLHEKDLQYLRRHLTKLQAKILYLEDLWDDHYLHPIHTDEDFESEGTL